MKDTPFPNDYVITETLRIKVSMGCMPRRWKRQPPKYNLTPGRVIAVISVVAGIITIFEKGPEIAKFLALLSL